MKNIIFTLCSNNYLAHAKTLGDSVRATNPEFEFIIGLVDKRDPQIDYTFFKGMEIINYDTIGFPIFEEMILKYNVIEFNTAVKPFYLKYLLDRHGIGSKVFYIDPDIVFYSGMEKVISILDDSNIVITPNLTRADVEVNMGELASLRHGMFNLGFIGVRHNEETFRFLQWWQNRLKTHCVINKPKGLFVDQKWIDFVPLFFKDVCILYQPGYNMAWWNLSERILVKDNGKYYVNDLSHVLVFFHFSGYTPGSSHYTGRVNNSDQFSLAKRMDLQEAFTNYSESLIKNDYTRLTGVKPQLPFVSLKTSSSGGIRNRVKSLVKRIIRRQW